jgi:hypothetical protein
MSTPSPTTLDVQSSSSWPTTFTINAYAGKEKAASGNVSEESRRWPLRNAPPKIRTFLKPPKPVDLANWRDPEVGWGIVAAALPGTDDSDLASGADLPEPIQQLRKDRGNAPVFRYRVGWDQRFRLLRNYADKIDVAIGQSPRGTARECIPHYLLICGTPEQVPWELQYVLNAHYAVGRLHLTGVALENYVSALRSGWQASGANAKRSVIWAVNYGGNDITSLMRNLIAAKVNEKLAGDTDLSAGVKFLDGAGAATSAELTNVLAASKPSLVVTTSHGQTYPLDNLDTLRNELGLLVDQNYASVRPESLLDSWQPDGTVWYAHACCSAGCSAQTLFDGLTQDGSEVDQILKGVAKLGSRVSPLPTALLGASKPLRAFIGHVEPTFDWTLRNPDTNQSLTGSMQLALYSELYQPSPVGSAFRRWYERLGSLYTAYDRDQAEFSRGGNTRAAMLKDLLAARDVQSTVILGDPTATLPSL